MKLIGLLRDKGLKVATTVEKATKTPSQGAATICYVATNGAVKKVNGQYFEDCNVAIPGGHMRDVAMAGKLWAVSEDLTRNYLGSS